jgi:hypothetical protein
MSNIEQQLRPDLADPEPSFEAQAIKNADGQTASGSVASF